MNTPEWLKPGLMGAGCGAVAMAIIGFSWGGWVTGSKAEIMASNRAQSEVTAALVSICMEQSRLDPESIATLATLKDTSKYQRGAVLMKAGWATMPGSADPNSKVASACAEQLATLF
jgi:hypothetical protein